MRSSKGFLLNGRCFEQCSWSEVPNSKLYSLSTAPPPPIAHCSKEMKMVTKRSIALTSVNDFLAAQVSQTFFQSQALSSSCLIGQGHAKKRRMISNKLFSVPACSAMGDVVKEASAASPARL